MIARILLVEDEPSIAEIVEFALASEGFQTMWRALAGEAEVELTAIPYDLIILDLGLPDGSGLELLKRIRRVSEVPVAILSARNAELDRVLGLELGADDYIGKPFSPRELAARIKAILKRTARPNPAVENTAIGQPVNAVWFKVDTDRARICFRGRPLDLTRYEYLLLKTLLAQPERVFSRAQLMDRAWPDPAASFERGVDTHIKALRAKLREIDPRLDPIRTHRGLGYSVRTGGQRGRTAPATGRAAAGPGHRRTAARTARTATGPSQTHAGGVADLPRTRHRPQEFAYRRPSAGGRGISGRTVSDRPDHRQSAGQRAGFHPGPRRRHSRRRTHQRRLAADGEQQRRRHPRTLPARACSSASIPCRARTPVAKAPAWDWRSSKRSRNCTAAPSAWTI